MSTAYLLTSDEGVAHPIAGQTIIGRGGAADLVLPDRSVSRRHAAVRQDGRTVVVEDLDSSNGTYVNGELLTAATRLEDGDRILVGASELRVRVDTGELQIELPTPTEILAARPTTPTRP